MFLYNKKILWMFDYLKKIKICFWILKTPGGGGGEAGSFLWSRPISGFHDRPSKEICQSLPSMRVTGKPNHVSPPFCSGFAFYSRSITLYSLLAIFNDSSVTIRTKGMKDQLCVIFLASVVAVLVTWRGFAISGRKRSWRFYFAVVISRFITFQLHTDQLFFSNFYGK